MSRTPHPIQVPAEALSAGRTVIRRLLHHHQIQEAVDLGIRLKNRTPYADSPVDLDRTIIAVRQASTPPDGCAIGAYRDDKMVAAIVLQIGCYFWSNPRTGERFASDLFFASEHAGAGLRILRAGIAWAFGQPRVVECTFGVSSGLTPGKHDALYRRVGADRIGGIYMLRGKKT